MMISSRSLGLLVLLPLAPLFASVAGGCSSSTSGASPTTTNNEDGGTLITQPDASSDTDSGVVLLPSAIAASVSVGRLHTCALTTTGAVRCWGDGETGAVGDGAPLGSTEKHRAPVQVVGLTSGITAITSGDDHSCALTAAGGVKCWGINDHGQLGNAPSSSDTTVKNSSTPVDVVGLASGVKAIAGGADHTCALMTAGTVKCWGLNDVGQLGNGTTIDSGMPVDVTGLTGVTAIAGGTATYGSGHTCAIKAGGKVSCWGTNVEGQLAHDPEMTSGSNVPIEVANLSGAVAIAGGFYETCTIMTGGGAKCWGANDMGQIGNGTLDEFSPSVTVPTDVQGLTSGVTSLAVGSGYACAVVGGAAKCWGSNLNGELGNGQEAGFQTAVPVDVTGLGSGVASISAQGGAQNVCAVTTAGAIKCWGSNTAGSLGTTAVSTETGSNVPVAVLSFP